MFPWRYSRWRLGTPFQSNWKVKDINVRGCYIGFGVPISFILINLINGIHFLSLCLNFFMIHLNMVSIARSRSNSRSHKKKTMEKGLFPRCLL